MNKDQTRLTWEQIKEKYPHQNVGLSDVEYITPQGGAIKSAIVICTDKDIDRNDIALRAIRGELIMRYTTLDEDGIDITIQKGGSSNA